jgi:hypothetical protein
MAYSQPGIYNVLDPPNNMIPGGNPLANSTALQAVINEAEANGGGIIIIPSNDANNDGRTYPMAAQTGKPYCVSISGVYPLIIMGSGGATELAVQGNADLFDVSGFTGSSLGFQDLYVHYPGDVTGTAFNVTDCQNLNIFRVYIDDCEFPIACAKVVQGSIKECLISFTTAFKLTSATGIQIGPDSSGAASSQLEIIASVLRSKSSATTLIGLQVTAVDGLRAASLHLAGFTSAVQIVPSGSASCANIWLSYAQIDAAAGILIQPQSNTSSIANVTVFHTAINYPGTGSSTNGVTIDVNGHSNSQIEAICLDNCNVFGFGQYGLEVTGGEYLSVIGGLYASNAAGGINIVGSANQVVLEGVTITSPSYLSTVTQPTGLFIQNLGGSAPSNVSVTACTVTSHTSTGVVISNGASGVHIDNCVITGNAAYGIAVSNSCSAIYLEDCNLTGNPSGALNASTPGTLQVTNCAGYNDQIQNLATVAPMSGMPFSGATYGYYGPVTFYTAQAGITLLTITIDGTNTHLSSGTFTIGPAAPSGGESAQLTYSATPSFLLVGQ